MLGKLMKYEISATSRILVPLYLVLLCMSIANRFIYRLGIKEGILAFLTGFMLILQIFLIIAILATTAIFMILRFYKNLLSDEGYLMFTLPVSSHHLILSKLIITVLWTLISIIIIIASLCLVFATSSNISFVFETIKQIFTELVSTFGGNWTLMLINMIFLILLSLISSIQLIYTSIAVGQLFTRHKIIGSFIAYIILYSATQLFFLTALLIFSYAYNGTIFIDSIAPLKFFPFIISIVLIACIVYYTVTNYMFRKKLNLE